VDLRKTGLAATDAKLLDPDERFLLALLGSGATKEKSQ
jgi:hypothetical protein